MANAGRDMRPFALSGFGYAGYGDRSPWNRYSSIDSSGICESFKPKGGYMHVDEDIASYKHNTLHKTADREEQTNNPFYEIDSRGLTATTPESMYANAHGVMYGR